MFRRLPLLILTTLAALLLVAGVASAHAAVSPGSVAANSYEKFQVRVPVEKESATVKVRLEIPESFAISRVRPLPGWSYTVEKSADGKALKAIVWADGKILPGEFQDFEFQGKSATDPGKYAFRIFQTYADGETVAWSGASDAKTPASVVTVVAAAPTADEHGAPAVGAVPAPAAGSAGKSAGGSPLTTAAAYGGLVLGLAGLIVALVRR